MTVFIVSQRASSLQHADQILVLDDGQLVGLGTHAELLDTCPVYRGDLRQPVQERRRAAMRRAKSKLTPERRNASAAPGPACDQTLPPVCGAAAW